MAADLDAGAWPIPPVFSWLTGEGAVPPDEMARTFNCGIGMVAVVAAEDVETATAILSEQGETVFRIGEIVTRGGGDTVRLQNLENAWRA